MGQISVGGLVNRRVARIRRIYYVFRGEVDGPNGPVELNFVDGTCALFDAGPDGDSLRVTSTPWLDPFREPLSAVNEEFVRESGKWTGFDVSTEPAFAKYVGATILSVSGIAAYGLVAGALLSFADGHLKIEAAGDELYVEAE